MSVASVLMRVTLSQNSLLVVRPRSMANPRRRLKSRPVLPFFLLRAERRKSGKVLVFFVTNSRAVSVTAP